MQNLWRESFEWADLPIWRKVLIVPFIVLLCIVSYRPFSMEVDIYTTAPSKPVQETGQVIPVYVNHGYLRYLTYAEAKDYRYWNDMSPVFMGASVLGMVGVVVTYRPGKRKL